MYDKDNDPQDRDSISKLLNQWEQDSDRQTNIVSWSQTQARQPKSGAFPEEISARLIQVLNSQNIRSLYSHQSFALKEIFGGGNVVISTGTASGKSLIYSLAIWNKILKDPNATALCFFPTKALAYDQLNSFKNFESELFPGMNYSIVAAYDGDTPPSQRSSIRENAHILLTNPDMLHLGILPHHTIWERILRNLSYIVIDEVHIYRGVFGSHVSNLIRRIKRILEFYDAHPQFILTSATIGNPQQLTEKLIEEPVTWIHDDGSPKGEKTFLIYNPPIVNQDLGIRQGLLDTTSQLASDLIAQNIQTLVFSRTRRGVEVLLRKMIEKMPGYRRSLAAYRSGYLRNERREIELKLKNRQLLLAAATNALELGIDIGGVDAVLLAGYPGTIAATTQRAGRAGRSTRKSLAVMIASSAPIDQYLALHPEFVLDQSPEEALINPSNPLILLQHIQCAAFELPFTQNDYFGKLSNEMLKEYLDYLLGMGVLQLKANRYYWMSDDYPANSISLRNSNSREILLQTIDEEGMIRTIGEVDYLSSLWMVHSGAIYLQGGETYYVEKLDLEKNIAFLTLSRADYTTDPIKSVEIKVLQEIRTKPLSMCTIYYGDLSITTQVTGFKKIHWDTQEILDTQPLDLPATNLRTFGYWMVLNDICVEKMREEGMWKSDPNDYGPAWNQIRSAIRLRDGFRCQNCGRVETGKAFHVHHKVPFKAFQSAVLANAPSNLVTLCPECHRQAETLVRVRSAISGIRYAMSNLAPLLVMCDSEDLDSDADGAAPYADGQPAVLIFDSIPAGIGLSDSLYEKHQDLLQKSLELINACSCSDGCPSCVGPVSPEGYGGKMEATRLLELLVGLN